jgi:hypothetical protein
MRTKYLRFCRPELGVAERGAAIPCHSGWIRSALRLPKLSSQSQLYQPARLAPICTSHGQTWAGGASTVAGIVAVRFPPETRSAPG